MDIRNLTATRDFYPGKQRISVFALKEVRIPLIYLAIYCPVAVTVWLKLGGKYGEVFDFANTLFFFLPVVISLVGGVSKKAWMAYAGFAALSFSGMSAYALTSLPLCLLALIPGFGFLVFFNHLAPQVLKAFGITGKLSVSRELSVALLMTVALPLMVIRLTTSLDFIVIKYMPFTDYVYYTVTCILLYVPMIGCTYGIIAGRLLAFNFQLIVPILINTVIFSLYYMSTTLSLKASFPILAGLVLCTFGIQMILGLGYFYSKTTRFLFLAYLVFYLIYKSLGT